MQTANFGAVSLAGTGASDAKSFFENVEAPQLSNRGITLPQGLDAIMRALVMTGRGVEEDRGVAAENLKRSRIRFVKDGKNLKMRW